ncbi:hypothetical protein D9757_003304 [Collybiopsis confluens]|uniref:Glucanase n=1 Tax=Collybiopsis confluens TaxID=2823264 RepID=A0A8H5MFM7_9AGAR|nr:hypothetical protein D9757_003304 [Collybiopsis confluens]
MMGHARRRRYTRTDILVVLHSLEQIQHIHRLNKFRFDSPSAVLEALQIPHLNSINLGFAHPLAYLQVDKESIPSDSKVSYGADPAPKRIEEEIQRIIGVLTNSDHAFPTSARNAPKNPGSFYKNVRPGVKELLKDLLDNNATTTEDGVKDVENGHEENIDVEHVDKEADDTEANEALLPNVMSWVVPMRNIWVQIERERARQSSSPDPATTVPGERVLVLVEPAGPEALVIPSPDNFRLGSRRRITSEELQLALLSLAYLAVVHGQQPGTNTAETHPPLSWQKCTAPGSCTTQSGSVVLDSNWRWTHAVGGYTNCYTGNTWNATVCPDGTTCAKNCAIDGADYTGTYGITASGNALTLKFVTTSQQKNIGSRVYLMASGSQTNYQTFNLLNQEFTFDVDVSQLPCGLNGALYFVQMDADGGLARFSGNKAGAKYGTGYCDAQCPRDIKFINGQANVAGWQPSSTDVNAGTGNTGTCCTEMDIWEANSVSTAYTPHPCTVTSSTSCTGTSCSAPNSTAGVCDQAGCDFNSYRMGVTNFYGPGSTVNTNSKFTVVTQFVTSNNSTSGSLSAIRRLYVQNGKVIQNSQTNIPGITATNEIDTNFCSQQKTAFGDPNTFSQKGGLAGVGSAFQKGMVLTLSLWDDHAAEMLWLDSTYPPSKTGPGAARGTCATTSGQPTDVENQNANAQVTYSNIKVGPIGSTYNSDAE